MDTINKDFHNEIYFCLSIQIKDFPLGLYQLLVEYIHYHNIMVLQIYRQALIASYLDVLNSEITMEYIEQMEEQRDKLSKMIKLFPKYIKHQRFDYEDLIGIYSSSYWDGLMMWIGKSLSANKINAINKLEDYKVNVQPSCSLQKWKWIEQILSDTEQYYLKHNFFWIHQEKANNNTNQSHQSLHIIPSLQTSPNNVYNVFAVVRVELL